MPGTVEDWPDYKLIGGRQTTIGREKDFVMIESLDMAVLGVRTCQNLPKGPRSVSVTSSRVAGLLL